MYDTKHPRDKPQRQVDIWVLPSKTKCNKNGEANKPVAAHGSKNVDGKVLHDARVGDGVAEPVGVHLKGK